MAKMARKGNDKLKNKEVSIATNPVENMVIYKDDLTANLYVFLKLMLI